MKKLWNLAPIGIGLVIAVGCGKVEEAGQSLSQSIKSPELMHTWASKCTGSKVLGKSMMTFVAFSGNNLTQVHEFYDTGECKDAVASLKYTGTFTLPGKAASHSDIQLIDLNYQDAKVTALNDSGKKLLEATGFCGQDKWTIGQERVISAESHRSTCPVKKLPRTEFDIYRIEGKNVFFGNLGLIDGVNDSAKRPTQIDEKSPLWPSDRPLK